MTTRLLIVIGLATAPLAAQHPAAPMGRMMGDPMGMQEMMAPMAQVMLYTPQHLLPRKEALGLTADQVARLTALRDATTAAQDAAMSEARAHLEELQQAAEAASPDSGVVKTHFQAAHAAMGRAHWLSIRSAMEAKALLTAGQRATLKAWADSLETWMQQHRQMMKPSPSR
jgi:Spy/CpxP family protein refolding chaperone